MSRLIDAEHFEQILIDLIDHGDHKNPYVHHAYKMRNVAINECRKMLWAEPTVDASHVKHGYWIWSDDLCEYCCSRCGHTDDYGIHPDIEYCPYCGALMNQVVVDE